MASWIAGVACQSRGAGAGPAPWGAGAGRRAPSRRAARRWGAESHGDALTLQPAGTSERPGDTCKVASVSRTCSANPGASSRSMRRRSATEP